MLRAAGHAFDRHMGNGVDTSRASTAGILAQHPEITFVLLRVNDFAEQSETDFCEPKEAVLKVASCVLEQSEASNASHNRYN